MEILKQPQYSPIPVELQVMIIYAAINHHLAEVGVVNIKAFEKGFYEFVTASYPEIGTDIKKQGKLTEETEELLKKAIEAYKEKFLKEIGASIVQPDIEQVTD